MKALDAVATNLGLYEWMHQQQGMTWDELFEKSQGGGVGDIPQNCDDACGFHCLGPNYNGDAWGGSSGECCALATNEANFLCSNCYCLGCCSLGSCFVQCYVDPYYCNCNRAGRACSKDPFCDDEWPPDCV